MNDAGMTLSFLIATIVLALPSLAALWVYMRQRPSMALQYEEMERVLASQQKRYEQQTTRLDELERQRMNDHGLILELYRRLSAFETYVGTLVGQLQKAGIAPAPLPELLRTPVAVPVDKRALRQRLATLFDLDEMESLMFELGIDDEALAARTREGRARELVDYAERHGMLEVLAEAVARLRPVT